MAVATAPRTDLLERDEPLAHSATAFAEARPAAGSLVFVGGEAGVGKTSAGAALRRRARRQPPVPLGRMRPACSRRHRSGRSSRSPPQAPSAVADALEAGAAHAIAAALLGAGTAGAARRSCSRTSTGPTRRRSTSCACSAGGWAARRRLAIATYRDDELDRMHPLRIVLGELATAHAVRRLDVRPLSRDAVAALAAGSDVDPGALHDLTARQPLLRHRGSRRRRHSRPRHGARHRARTCRAAEPAGGRGRRGDVDRAARRSTPSCSSPSAARRPTRSTNASPAACCAPPTAAWRSATSCARTAVEDSLSPTRRLALHRAVLLALADDAPHGRPRTPRASRGVRRRRGGRARVRAGRRRGGHAASARTARQRPTTTARSASRAASRRSSARRSSSGGPTPSTSPTTRSRRSRSSSGRSSITAVPERWIARPPPAAGSCPT